MFILGADGNEDALLNICFFLSVAWTGSNVMHDAFFTPISLHGEQS